MKKLSALIQGEKATVSNVLTQGAMRRRFQELGLVPGTEVFCLQKSFFKNVWVYFPICTIFSCLTFVCGDCVLLNNIHRNIVME